MSTPFRFEHVFRAPSVAAVFTAYFDPGQLRRQDRALGVVERQVVELVDDGHAVRRTCRVVPGRQIPAILRPFTSGPLHYLETATWRRSADAIEVAIQSSLDRGASPERPTIRAMYRLSRLSDGSIRRRYDGTVSVGIALLSTRIERGIVAEIERSMPLAAACTQEWLDETFTTVAAQA